MAPPLHRRGGRYRWIPRLISAFIITSFGLCIVTPVVFLCLRMRTNRSISSRVAISLSCPSCYCDCSYEDFLPIPCRPTSNNSSSSADDVEVDPEEMGKDTATLIKEELRLLKIVSEENAQRYKLLIASVKKTSSHYQSDAEKCDRGVRSCEQARERAQEEFVKERRRTALWRKRAQRLPTP